MYRLTETEKLALELSLTRLRKAHDERLRDNPDARRMGHAAVGIGFEPSCHDVDCACNSPAVRS